MAQYEETDSEERLVAVVRDLDGDEERLREEEGDLFLDEEPVSSLAEALAGHYSRAIVQIRGPHAAEFDPAWIEGEAVVVLDGEKHVVVDGEYLVQGPLELVYGVDSQGRLIISERVMAEWVAVAQPILLELGRCSTWGDVRELAEELPDDQRQLLFDEVDTARSNAFADEGLEPDTEWPPAELPYPGPGRDYVPRVNDPDLVEYPQLLEVWFGEFEVSMDSGDHVSFRTDDLDDIRLLVEALGCSLTEAQDLIDAS